MRINITIRQKQQHKQQQHHVVVLAQFWGRDPAVWGKQPTPSYEDATLQPPPSNLPVLGSQSLWMNESSAWPCPLKKGATAGPGQFPLKGQYATRKRRVEAGSRGAQQRS